MRRGRIDIIHEILSASSSGIGKTAIVYRTNLNFHIVDRYLGMLSKEGLISVSRESPVKYQTTSKGTDFVATFSQLKKIVNVS